MSALIDHLRGLYGPSADYLAATLPDMADGLTGQLVKLSRDPTPERCDAVAANLAGARNAVLRLKAALERELGPPPEAA